MSKEFKVGLLTVVSGVILYFGFTFLKGYDLFSSTVSYHVIYDNIGGLTPSNPVQINGLNVGKVVTLTILQDKKSKILVVFDVLKSIKLNKGSVAVLKDNGLLGDKMIELVVNEGDEIMPKDTLKAGTELGMMAVVSAKISPLMTKIDSTITSVNELLDEYKGLGTNVKNVLVNIETTTGSANGLIADNRQRIGNITANLEKLSASLVETEKSIKPLIVKMNTVADSVNAMKLASTMAEARKSVTSLNEMLNAMNKGETMTKLVKNDSAYVNLNKTIVSLDKLLIDFKEHPKKYVHFSLFGKKEAKK